MPLGRWEKGSGLRDMYSILLFCRVIISLAVLSVRHIILFSFFRYASMCERLGNGGMAMSKLSSFQHQGLAGIFSGTKARSLSVTRERYASDQAECKMCHQEARKMVIVSKKCHLMVYLKLTQDVIQSRNASKMNGSQPNWDAREIGSEQRKAGQSEATSLR